MSANFKLTWMKEGNIMNYARTIGAVLLLTSLLAACGGGDGGGFFFPPGGGNGGAPPPLTAGTFVKTYGPAASVNSNYPFSDADIKHQTLYTASEVGGAGKISALHFRRSTAAATPVTCPNATVRLGHTSLSALTSDFASNIDRSSLVTVLNNATVAIPAGAINTWFEIPFTTPFGYNGVDNLVVEIEKTAGCTNNVLVTFFDGGVPGQRAYSIAADSNPDTAQHNQFTANAVDVLQPWAKFTFAGGDDPVRYPVTQATGNSLPFAASSGNRHVQMLHLSDDINGSGPITGIAMISNEAPTNAASYTVNIKLGHTTLAAFTALANTFASNFNVGSPATVAIAATFTVPAGVPAGTPIWLPLSGTFNYNGIDNLIVDIEVTGTVTEDTRIAMDDTIAGRRLYAAVGAATGTVAAGAYHTVFRFNGAPVQVMPLTNSVNTLVLGSTDPGGQIQNLYDSTSLGTGGRITNVAVRLFGSTLTATSLANYKVYMGHTAKTQYNIADTYASNMDENMPVFNGTLTIPAGLKQGDWVSIPLQTPFTYDPGKNLSILFTSDFGAAGNAVYEHVDSTRFPLHAGYRVDNAVDTGGTPSWIYHGAVNVQLQIEK